MILLRTLGQASFVVQAIAFTAASLVVGVPLGIIAFLRDGRQGLEAVALAAAICWAPGLISLQLVRAVRFPQVALINATVGMLLRMGIALGLCLVIYHRGGPLPKVGFVFYLLIFYLATLAAETTLVTASISQGKPPKADERHGGSV